jgi:ATP-dependent DNA helicase DinG
LSVGAVLRARLWDRIPTVILLSATLTIENSFGYIRTVLSLDEFTTEIFETDFDYFKQALLYIPPELPDVSKSDQMRSVQ